MEDEELRARRRRQLGVLEGMELRTAEKRGKGNESEDEAKTSALSFP